MVRPIPRARFMVMLALAFLFGLALASAFDLTRFGYAQQAAPPTQQEVKPLAEVSNAFVRIAETVTPAVVSIETERDGTRSTRPRSQQRIPPGLEDFFRQFELPDQPAAGSGSGFIVSQDGYILTNNHVVADADRVTVRLVDGRQFRAKVVGSDPTTDVAVIKIDASGLTTVKLGDDAQMRIGDWVLAIGNPLGLDFTVTAGIVSAKGRNVRGLLNTPYAIGDFIQTDAAINPGNSGGPLVNIRGEVIGINNAIASTTGRYEGYGFAIPVSLAKEVMDDLIQHGEIQRAVLGVSIGEVAVNDARAAGLDEIRGAIVQGFTGDPSPAERAGLEPGDIIIAAAGQPVERVSSLQRIVRRHKPGETIEVEVMRFGKKRTFSVRLAEAPNAQQVASREREDDARDSVEGVSYERLGLTLTPIPLDIARQANLNAAQRGVLVTEVATDGPSHNLLFPQDVVLEVLNPGPRRAVRSPAELERVLRGLDAGDYVSLLVISLRDESRQTRVVNVRVR